MASLTSIPKGTRDFSTDVILKRDYIFDIIKKVFKLHGYQPIETPAMENLTTLLGKYGEEGDRLVFRILNSGDFIDNYQTNDLKKLDEAWNQLLKKVVNEEFPYNRFQEIVQSYQMKDDRISSIIYDYFRFTVSQIISHCDKKRINDGLDFVRYLKTYRYPHLVNKLKGFILTKAELTKGITEKGLRYDLTVPFARYVVQHQNEITFPFKRFQIQPVWRGDNPQKGRYREFYQCDADVIGTNSLLNEYELLIMIDEVFSQLNIKTIIKINNRKILTGIAEYIGEPNRIVDITIAIDKLDKMDIFAVNQELKDKGISELAILKLQPILTHTGDTNSKLNLLDLLLSTSESGKIGLDELKRLFELLKIRHLNANVELDLTLARGLNYYTGAIIEVKSLDFNIGSICGGGRYDDLTGIFGLKGMSGVGISFGADRIYDVLNHLEGFSSNREHITSILILNLSESSLIFNLNILNVIHNMGITCELYPDVTERKKQFVYADAKKIPYIIIASEDEINNNSLTLKIMSTGEQKKTSLDELSLLVKNEISSPH